MSTPKTRGATMTPQDKAQRIAEIRERVKNLSTDHGRDAIAFLLEALDSAERERDAYRKAKEENDERFMRERDEARRERDEAVKLTGVLRDTTWDLRATYEGRIDSLGEELRKLSNAKVDAVRERDDLRAQLEAKRNKCEIHAGARVSCGQCFDSNKQHLANAREQLEAAKKEYIESLRESEGETRSAVESCADLRQQLTAVRADCAAIQASHDEQRELLAARDAENKALREALGVLIVGANNTLPFAENHKGIVLSKHSEPDCIDAGFCIYKDARRRIETAQAALDAANESKRSESAANSGFEKSQPGITHTGANRRDARGQSLSGDESSANTGVADRSSSTDERCPECGVWRSLGHDDYCCTGNAAKGGL